MRICFGASKVCGIELRLCHSGLDCDVLIHEATMEDELVEDAVKKRHRFDIAFECSHPLLFILLKM